MRRIVIGLIVGMLCGGTLLAQQYSGPPVMQAFQTTNLTIPYTVGTVYAGGYQQVIQSGSVTLTDNQTSCAAPAYIACNFVYWSGYGTALTVTTSGPTAFQAGNAIVAFVTTAGGQITAVVPFSQASNQNDNLTPPNTVTSFGLRLPICNTILKQGCQSPTRSLSGY